MSVGVAVTIVGVYALAVGLIIGSARLPGYFLAAIALLNLVTYVTYWGDKRAAERGRRRMPESTLHLLGLLGGWPGALIAQTRFRHKTSKRSFRLTFFFTAGLNLVGLGYLILQKEPVLGRLADLIPAIAR